MTTALPVPRTAALHMLRAVIDVNRLHRWMGAKRLQDEDHAMHCLLTEAFGELAPKPFRLVVPRNHASGYLYGYAQAGAEEAREAVHAFADPAHAGILAIDSIESKPMPTEWRAGKRLGFEARVRPIVRLHREAPNGRVYEKDAFQAEADPFPKYEMKRTREEVYRDWLAAQFERIGGADLEQERVKLVSFRRVRSVRGARAGARGSEAPDALMRGNLTITDPAGFAALLARGVGRHRAYGYGMLLLRPPMD